MSFTAKVLTKAPKLQYSSFMNSIIGPVTSDMGMICIMSPAGPVSTKLDAKR